MSRINFYQAGDAPCLRDTEGMDERTYRHFCAELLRREGFCNVMETWNPGGRGADILAERDGQTWAVQCRKYQGSEVGADAVDAARAAQSGGQYARAAIFSNRPFSPAALKAAGKNSVELWGQKELEGMIQRAFPDYDVEYYKAMKARDKKGNLKRDGKIVIMYLLLAIVFYFIMFR